MLSTGFIVTVTLDDPLDETRSASSLGEWASAFNGGRTASPPGSTQSQLTAGYAAPPSASYIDEFRPLLQSSTFVRLTPTVTPVDPAAIADWSGLAMPPPPILIYLNNPTVPTTPADTTSSSSAAADDQLACSGATGAAVQSSTGAFSTGSSVLSSSASLVYGTFQLSHCPSSALAASYRSEVAAELADALGLTDTSQVGVYDSECNSSSDTVTIGFWLSDSSQLGHPSAATLYQQLSVQVDTPNSRFSQGQYTRAYVSASLSAPCTSTEGPCTSAAIAHAPSILASCLPLLLLLLLSMVVGWVCDTVG